MKKENSNLFSKGAFEDVDENFLKDTTDALNEIVKIQKKYNKKDNDTLLNEYHDGMAGKFLGFNLCNTKKHGFDCKLSKKEDTFLEVKTCSYSSSSLSATFNDTTEEKAESFCKDNVYLALAIWNNEKDLLCIAYGQNPKIGEYWKAKIDFFKSGKSVRSTQTISLSSLVFTYNFKILAIHDKKETLDLLKKKNSRFKKLESSAILTVEEFKDNGGIKSFNKKSNKT